MVSRNIGFKFKLVSYNILSQTLLNEHNFLYSNCNPRDLEWPRRGHRIVNELLDDKADIICLQEVELEHLHSLYGPRLAKSGYECLYKKRSGCKIDGCAIFYKSETFTLLQYQGVEFNRSDVSQLLNRDNVGIIAVLQPPAKTPPLVIANTHLLFNPKRTDIRIAQLKYFLSQLEEIMNERNHPTILCGDLNSSPDSPVNVYIANHSLKFKSAYPTMNCTGHRYISTFSGDIVDYIYYTKLRLDSYKELLTREEFSGPLPNDKFPSDHLSLKAHFTLR